MVVFQEAGLLLIVARNDGRGGFVAKYQAVGRLIGEGWGRI